MNQKEQLNKSNYLTAINEAIAAKGVVAAPCDIEHTTKTTSVYETGVPYANYALNICKWSCGFGCRYCYAYKMAHQRRKVQSMDDWMKPKLVTNTLQKLSRMRQSTVEKIGNDYVYLSFSGDPFALGHPEIVNTSLRAIATLNDKGLRCSVLSKWTLPEELALLSKDNEYGISFVSLNEGYRELWEPKTAKMKDRVAALKAMHDKGFKTWVSMEPYPVPNIVDQDLYAVLDSVSFADKIVFGRLNYCSETSAYDNQKEFYREKALQVIEYCKEHGIECIIKDGTM